MGYIRLQSTNQMGNIRLQSTNQMGYIRLQSTNQMGNIRLQSTNQMGYTLKLQSIKWTLHDSYGQLNGLYLIPIDSPESFLRITNFSLLLAFYTHSVFSHTYCELSLSSYLNYTKIR